MPDEPIYKENPVTLARNVDAVCGDLGRWFSSFPGTEESDPIELIRRQQVLGPKESVQRQYLAATILNKFLLNSWAQLIQELTQEVMLVDKTALGLSSAIAYFRSNPNIKESTSQYLYILFNEILTFYQGTLPIALVKESKAPWLDQLFLSELLAQYFKDTKKLKTPSILFLSKAYGLFPMDLYIQSNIPPSFSILGALALVQRRYTKRHD